MMGFRFLLVTSSHLTMFGQWKRVNSTLKPCGWSQMNMHTHPLRAACRRCDHWKSNHVVSQSVEIISLVGDHVLHQYHHVKAANL